ncbi:cytochrome P450 72A15-like [Hibiscus syriacus]|uniref:cytochrome P450 72A15-like n=1 Tax=Hibiscus syriacus TaxID=106335 RepID=UPI00192085A5|nr:cytochrome P450 72A15-like [Hibiscus syriacus]
MEDSLVTVRALLFSLVVGLLIIWGWRVLNWVWLKPKKLEKCLRQQGYSGNSYRFLFGEIKEILTMTRQARSKPKSSITDDIAPYVIPHYHQTVKTYGLSNIAGKNSIQWFGPSPRITITDPELIREIFTKYEFQKPRVNPLLRLLFSGLLTLEGDEWAKHRKIISHAFHQDKLKSMLPAFYECCTEMIDEWEKMVSVDGSSEVDVWGLVS